MCAGHRDQSDAWDLRKVLQGIQPEAPGTDDSQSDLALTHRYAPRVGDFDRSDRYATAEGQPPARPGARTGQRARAPGISRSSDRPDTIRPPRHRISGTTGCSAQRDCRCAARCSIVVLSALRRPDPATQPTDAPRPGPGVGIRDMTAVLTAWRCHARNSPGDLRPRSGARADAHAERECTDL